MNGNMKNNNNKTLALYKIVAYNNLMGGSGGGI